MTIMNRDQAKRIMDKVLSYSKSDECEINLNGQVTGNVRYALNTVTTAGVTEDVTLTVTAAYGKKTGASTVNQFDDKSLKRAVATAEELARLSPENEEYMPRLGQQDYLKGHGHYESTASITPEFRAKAAADSINPSREKDLTAAGFLNDNNSFQAMANSNGLFAYYNSTGVSFSTTIRTADRTGSGWVSRDYNDVNKLDTAAASRIAMDKSVMSREAKAIEPGKYTVILEPAGSADLIARMGFAMNQRLADEGRSFMTKKGGGTKLGEKLFDDRVTIYSDPQHTDCPYSPWASDGQARKRTVWVEKGVVKTMSCPRYWAQEHDYTSVPGPASMAMEGGDASLDFEMPEMVKNAYLKADLGKKPDLAAGLSQSRLQNIYQYDGLLTSGEILQIFRNYGIKRLAMNNGLNQEENRYLFTAGTIDEVIGWVLTGLARLRGREESRARK